jgi:ATP-dependent DNA helicase RecG
MKKSESQNIEYKESWRDAYLKWVCGFANAHGGRIYIGVADSKKIVGLADAKRLMEDIPNKIVNYLGIVVDVNLLTKDSKEYIEIDIMSSNIPIAYKGEYHYRSRSTKQVLKGVALQQFIYKKMGRSWDDIENERATLDDIDRSAIDYFLKKAITTDRMPITSLNDSTEDILYNLNLITDEGKLKNAALLLFGKRPSKFFTLPDFRIGRFIRSEHDLITQDIIEGNIIEMADKVVELLKAKYLMSPIDYKGLDRIETLELPEDALREAVFNAIIHKDYMGVHIQLKVYNDRLELWNEGNLPDALTVETLVLPHRSYPRNRNIANTFYKAGFIESWGRGISKITVGFKRVGAKAPTFENNDGGVLITMYRPNVVESVIDHVVNNAEEKLIARQQDVLNEIIKDNTISAKQLADILNVNDRTIQRDLDKLKILNLIDREGGRKEGSWIVVKDVVKDVVKGVVKGVVKDEQIKKQ